MNPSKLELLTEVKKAADAAIHGDKETVYSQACEQLGMSRATLMRRLRDLQAVSTRRQRADAGEVLLDEEDAKRLSALLMSGYRKNKKKITSIKLALEVLRANEKGQNGLGFATYVDAQTGELKELSSSACIRALRVYKLHPDQLNMPSPSQQQRSNHPNDVWLIDASISTLFYVPETGLEDMSPAEFYKNKPANFERIKRQRLTRYVITDHTSGAIFVHYVSGGESRANMAEAFLKCIQKRGSNPMHGVPFHLMMDPGSAGTSAAFGNLMHRLQVTPVVHKPGNPRASGQVEQAHNLVETNFESGFKLKRIASIEQINADAEMWMMYYNGSQTHSRHGLSRFSKWLEIKPHQLRTVDADLARSLLTHKPLTPRVNDFLQVNFAAKVWDVSQVPQILIGQKLEVTYNPFNQAVAYALLKDVDGKELLIEIPEVLKNEHGFNEGAALIGREYKQPADTIADTNRKQITRVMTNASTDEEAEIKIKGKAPAFDGAIDPYKHIAKAVEDMPMFIERQGLELEAGMNVPSVQAKAPRVLSHFEATKEVINMGVEMSKERRLLIERLYPAGVPEDALQQLKEQLTTAGKLRVVSGEN